MSDGPQPPGAAGPAASCPTVPQAAWPRERTWPHTWPEQPAVPGQRVSLEPSAWPERYAIRPAPERYGQYSPGQHAQEWAPLPLAGHESRPMVVAPKNPAVSVLLSVFIPGLGSMVNDNASTGVTILILNVIGWMLAILLIGIPLAIGTWIWGMVDAYQSAQRWNRAHGIVS